MNESESKNEKPKEERRFDPELLKNGLRSDLDQYEMLLRCSKKKDITEWNEWRKDNLDTEILLEGANIAKARRVSAEQEVFSEAYLEDANLSYAYLERADLRSAHLNGANLFGAHLDPKQASSLRLPRSGADDFTGT